MRFLPKKLLGIRILEPRDMLVGFPSSSIVLWHKPNPEVLQPAHHLNKAAHYRIPWIQFWQPSKKNGERALTIILLSSSDVNWQLEHAGQEPAGNVPSIIQALLSHHGNTCAKRNLDPGVACTRPKGLTSPTSGGLRGRDGDGVDLGARATCSKVRHQSTWRQNGSGCGQSARAPTGSPPRLPGASAGAKALTGRRRLRDNFDVSPFHTLGASSAARRLRLASRAVDVGAVRSGFGPPAARPGISRCCDTDKLAAAANRRVPRSDGSGTVGVTQ